MRKLRLNCNTHPSFRWPRVFIEMKPWRINRVEDYALSHVWPRGQQPPLRPSHLHLVSTHELESLSRAVANGNVPLDLETKLSKLALGNLGHRYIEQNCRIIFALLQAVHEGSFKAINQAEYGRLLRMLAYVRKDDDAIPDYRPDGFIDDQKEVRSVTTDLDPLLQTFKAWRLRNQVPGMWMGNPLAPVPSAVHAG